MQIGDGINDGKFTIKKNQGLSQAIVEEMGLTKEQTKKIGKSIWSQIFEEVKEESKTNKLFRGGDCFDCGSGNFVVYEGQQISFSEERWAKIQSLVDSRVNSQNPQKPVKTTNNTSTNPVKNNKTTTKPAETPAKKPAAKDEKPVVNNTKDASNKIMTTDLYTALDDESKIVIRFLKDNIPRQAVVLKSSTTAAVKNDIRLNMRPEVAAHVLKNCPELLDRIAGFGSIKGGLTNEDIRDFVLMPLAKRFDALGLRYKDGKSGVDHVKNLTDMDLIKKYIQQMSEHILRQEAKGNIPEENIFNQANELLVSVAQMENKPAPKKERERGQKITLDDGRYITVIYDGTDKKKKIAEVKISYDTKTVGNGNKKRDPQELWYTKNGAFYGSATQGPEGFVSKGYDFDEICRLVIQIFAEPAKK